jgi:hypothetical protein
MLLATFAVAAATMLGAPPDGIPADAHAYTPGRPGVDRRAGVVVTSDANGPVLVGLVDAGCAVTLPRAEWWLWRDGDTLRGHAGLLNVTVEGGPSDLAPRAALEGWRDRMRARFGDAIERAEITGGEDGLVLAVLTDVGRAGAGGAAYAGVRQLALFAAKRRGPDLVLVHLSSILPPGAPPPDEAAWRGYLTRGFVPDAASAGRR